MTLSIAENLKQINEMGYCTKGGNFGCLCKKCQKGFREVLDKILEEPKSRQE